MCRMKLDTEVNPCFFISRLIRSIHFCSMKKLNRLIIVWCKYTHIIHTNKFIFLKLLTTPTAPHLKNFCFLFSCASYLSSRLINRSQRITAVLCKLPQRSIPTLRNHHKAAKRYRQPKRQCYHHHLQLTQSFSKILFSRNIVYLDCQTIISFATNYQIHRFQLKHSVRFLTLK